MEIIVTYPNGTTHEDAGNDYSHYCYEASKIIRKQFPWILSKNISFNFLDITTKQLLIRLPYVLCEDIHDELLRFLETGESEVYRQFVPAFNAKIPF